MKAIILSRVSTVKQDLLQQTNELLKEATRDGYAENDIIIIENKESGISNDEEHLNGIVQMKELIDVDPSIKTVYVYEVSRLSRRPTVLYSIRDFLLERNVQLVVLKPYLRLIDIDGKMSQSAAIMFSLFSSISESEMMIKKERMMRGKRMKMSQGKYVGGNVCFGYTIDASTRQIVIDEKTSLIVRKIFNMYTREDHSVRSITKELMETGEIQHTEVENGIAFIKLVLKSPQYTGGTSAKGLSYPQIISEQQFSAAREKSIAARRSPKSKTKYDYLLKKMLYYKGIGRLLTATKRNYSISSIRHQKFWSISADAVDSIVWHYTKQFFKTYSMINVIGKDLLRMKQNGIALRKKQTQCFRNIGVLKEKHKRIENRILNGKLDEARGDKMLDEIMLQIQELKKMAAAYYEEHRQNTQKIIDMKENKFDVEREDISIIDKISIIRKTIKLLEIESTPGHGCSSLCITFIDGNTVNVEIQKKNRYLKVFENGQLISLS